VAKDGELLTKGEIIQSQVRAVPHESTEEQENDSEDTGASPRVSCPRNQPGLRSMLPRGRKAKIAKAGRNFQEGQVIRGQGGVAESHPVGLVPEPRPDGREAYRSIMADGPTFWK